MITGLLVGVAHPAGAQVRPDTTKRPPVARDTTKRDTTKVSVPVPDRVRDSLRLDSADAVSRARPIAASPSGPTDSLKLARARAVRDSIAKFRAGDTVRAPIARFEEVPSYELTDRLTFDRREILSSGAVNLADLLDKVPGVTSFRSGWIAGIHAASFNGDFSRIRLFLDGIELDAPEARNGGILDLDDVPLWTLDELSIERTAGEVRVWMRSWTYNKTIPYTRVDIFTGDRNTNGFRGLFAKRFRNGFVLQIGAQQAATQTGTVSAFTTSGVANSAGDGSMQVVNGRVGWSKRRLTIDLYGTVNTRERDPQSARKNFTSLPGYNGARREGYLRVAFGDTSTGFWTQAVLSAVATTLNGVKDTTTATTATDSAVAALAKPDSVRSRSQQMLAVGFRAKNWQYSLVDRVRSVQGTSFHAPAFRASLGSSHLGAGVYLERTGIDSTTRVDLSSRYEPIRWFVLSLSQSLRSPTKATERPSTSTTRAEAGIRLGGMLFSGGYLREDSSAYNSPTLLGASAAQLIGVPGSAFTGSVRGRLYKDLRLDLQAIRWNNSQFGRPQTSVRAELALISDWRSHFKKGEFSFNARLMFDMRDPVPFFYGVKTDGTADIRSTVGANVLSSIVEIRIQRATLFYSYRNLTGGDYEQIPGLTMPPSVQMYGVRWEFFN